VFNRAHHHLPLLLLLHRFQAIRSGLALTLLGGSTGDPAAGDCAPSCLGLVRDKDIWLFDVGEDVQRSLLHREHLKPSKVRWRCSDCSCIAACMSDRNRSSRAAVMHI
jgi:hypothetical protein